MTMNTSINIKGLKKSTQKIKDFLDENSNDYKKKIF